MFLQLTVNFRRILAIGLIFLTLFLGTAVASDRALAEVSQSEVDIPGEVMDDTEYESAKANRRELQAELSKQAAEANSNPESASEKLNLDEITPPPLKDNK
jgi:hypothetical protein